MSGPLNFRKTVFLFFYIQQYGQIYNKQKDINDRMSSRTIQRGSEKNGSYHEQYNIHSQDDRQ